MLAALVLALAALGTSLPAAADEAALTGAYAARIHQQVIAQWVRPASVPPGRKCRVSIVQLPGGDVLSAKVLDDCPFDEAGKRSVEAAVLRASPLPYRGFERVFSRALVLSFWADDPVETPSVR